MGLDRVSKGETFSIYGRHLTIGGGNSYLYIEESNRWLTSVSENPYKADYVWPNDLANGTYTLWAHNGHGRAYGWARSVSITIQSGIDWAAGNTINVTTKGANGSDSNDDLAAINTAIAAAGVGDTIYFPAGTYLVSDRVRPTGGTRMLGAGMDTTTISSHSSMSSGTIINPNGTSGFVFKDITFSCGPYPTSCTAVDIRWKSNMRFENVRVTHLGGFERSKCDPYRYVQWKN